jgi:hypothetical protein
MDDVEAAQSAYLAKRWAQPVRIFGYIVVGAGVLVVVGGLIGGVASMDQKNGATGLLVVVGALILGALMFLQGSMVLMLSYYVKMRSEEVTKRVNSALYSSDTGVRGRLDESIRQDDLQSSIEVNVYNREEELDMGQRHLNQLETQRLAKERQAEQMRLTRARLQEGQEQELKRLNEMSTPRRIWDTHRPAIVLTFVSAILAILVTWLLLGSL